jgi:hypothetical protein
MTNKFQVITILTLLIVICTPMLSLAAGPGFSGGVSDGGACAPLDEGTCSLLAAGAGYVAKMFYSKKKKATATANGK